MDEHALRSMSTAELEKLQQEGFDRTDPSGPWVVAFTFAIVLTLVVVVFAVQYLFQATLDQNEYQQVLAPESQELQEIRTREAEQLNHYRFSDKAKGTVRIPIDRAMELFAVEAQQGKLFYPAKSAPVKTAEQLAAGPDGGAAAPAGSTPAAPAGGAPTPQGGVPVAQK